VQAIAAESGVVEPAVIKLDYAKWTIEEPHRAFVRGTK
jgi:hypothetical protein